jgi:broad-specificity NMP kinase
MKIIVITGTPAVGKTRFANAIAKSLNAESVGVTDIVLKKKLYMGTDKNRTLIVKMADLNREVRSIISLARANHKDAIVLEGHILADMRVRGAVVIVLRAHLKELLVRMKKRKYGQEKIRDNLISEATDYCGSAAASNYNNVYEFLSGDARLLPKAITAINSGSYIRVAINIMPELLSMLKSRHLKRILLN